MGKEEDDFCPPKKDEYRDVWLARIKDQAEERTRKIATVFSPQCAFTTRIVSLDDEDAIKRWNPMMVRTTEPADGVVINRLHVAGAICNADCPVVIVWDKHTTSNDRPKIGVLHCGLRCVLPLGGGPGILHKAFQVEREMFNAKTTQAFVGYGIGPCCYGLDEVPLAVDPSCVKKATKGPRIDKKSVDLYALIKRQLVAIGVPSGNIQIDDRCTACSPGPAGKGFHSHVYDGARAGRNLVLAWMEGE